MKRIFYILLILILTGCTAINVHKTLMDVETYIAERPDSALAVIEAMDTTDLTTKGLRAHHALLHAMALDKNYIDVTDDSLALKAVNYYQKRGPRKNYARALYYLSLTYFRTEQYESSMNYLSMAEIVAEKHDSLYLGFVKVLQASAYNQNYNDLEELECLKKALQVYTSLGAEYYINVAELGLASSYISNEKYGEAKILLEKLINSSNLNNKMHLQALNCYAFLLATMPEGDYNTASILYETVALKEDGRYMSNQDYWVWAYALSEIGEINRAYEIIDSLMQIDSSGTAFYFMYLIAKNEGDQTAALNYLEKFSDKNNDEVVKILQQSISSIQRDFYQSQYETTDIKAKNRLLAIICIVIAAAFLMVVIFVVTIRYRRRKELEKEQYIRYAEEVNRQLKEFKQDTYSLLQKKYISMYKTRYETLGILFDQYVQSNGRTDSEQLVYRKVVSLIDELRNEIGINEDFELMLDKDLDGIMTKFHSAFPDLKKKDYALFGYMALGFDATIISHFMNCTVNTVYIRKSRLKKVIEESDSEYKSLFGEIIS
jgi:hypothetical protein